LPEGWAVAQLADCVEILDHLRVPVNSEEREKRKGPIPYFGATGQVGWIDDYLFDEELLLLGEDGAPFLDKSKPIAYIINGKTWVNNHAHVLRALNNLTSNQFLKYCLDVFDFSDSVTGTTRLKLTQGAMRSIPITVPPLSEQKRIVVKLEELIAQVNATRHRLTWIAQILKRFRQAVLTAAFSEGEPTSLSDVVRDLKYGTAQKCTYKLTGTPVLRIPNIGGGSVKLDDLKYAKLPSRELAALRLEPGDILMIRSNGSVSLVGKTALVSEREAGFAYAGYLIRLRANASRVLPEYLNLALQTHSVREQIEIPARSTSGVHNINSTEVLRLQINLPDLDLQRATVSRVEALFKLADAIEERVEVATKRAEKMTQAILAKAFRGELVPTEAELARREGRDYEPASVLLDRIRVERERSTKTANGT
jgi:type I restriction enzyme S subunit